MIEFQGIELNEYGMIKVDNEGRTTLNKVYTGGDTIQSKATVCRAIADGKNVAKAILKDFTIKL